MLDIDGFVYILFLEIISKERLFSLYRDYTRHTIGTVVFENVLFLVTTYFKPGIQFEYVDST